jgi:HD-GYP domain-containing protein (c-di-GMP phosphodiesterase class II)
MNTFNLRSLKQILRHETVQDGLNRLASQLGTLFRVVDGQGSTLAGDKSLADEARIPVAFGENTVAWMIAPQYGAVLANVLESMIALEMEKKAVAVDALEMYREINLLFRLHESVDNSLNLNEVCNSLAGEVRRLTNCDASMLFLVQEEQLRMVAGITPHHRETLQVGVGIVGHVLSKGEADIFNHVKRALHYVGETDYPAMMCAPLKTGNTKLGILVAAGAGPFLANDLKLLTTLASHGSIVIHNALLYTELRDLFQSTVSALAETIEKRDPYTAGHTLRVTDYSVMTAKFLGLSSKELNNLQLSATLHDIGKIGVRDQILLKASPLDQHETEQMKLHTEYGADILNCGQLLHTIVDGVRFHHERFDGKGYNHGLKGGDIPLHARIIAVADAFDAMTTDRPYRKGMDAASAIHEMKKGAGSQFDPDIVNAFLTALAEKNRADAPSQPGASQ